MHRARIGDGRAYAEVAANGALWILAGLLCQAVIARHPWVPHADQLALILCSPFRGAYPSPTSGLTSCWISGLVQQATAPDLVSQNLALRSAAAWAYLGAGGLLISLLVRPFALRCLGAALLIGSLFPFLWLSSELIASALLCLCVAGVWRRWPPLGMGPLLVGLGFAKPDLLLVALVLGTLRFRQLSARRDRVVLLASAGALTSALLAPGLVQYGVAYPTRSQRAFHSFAQHAHILFSGRLEWEGWEQNAARYFPGARSVPEVIVGYPGAYLRYVGLSVARGLTSISSTFDRLLWTVPVMGVWFAVRRGPWTPWAPWCRVAAWTLVGIVPWVLLSYPHIRYFARYFPIFSAGLLAFMQRVATHEPTRGGRLAVTLSCGICALWYAADGARAVLASFALPLDERFWSD